MTSKPPPKLTRKRPTKDDFELPGRGNWQVVRVERSGKVTPLIVALSETMAFDKVEYMRRTALEKGVVYRAEQAV